MSSPRCLSHVQDERLDERAESNCSFRGTTPDMTIVDGCAVLWKIQWPSANGTVQDFVKGFHKFVYDMLKKNDVMIIFDRYYDYSIQSVARENRNVIQSSKRVKITLTGPAHDKNVVLVNKDNKI